MLAKMNEFSGDISKYIKKYKLYVLRDVIFFIIITNINTLRLQVLGK